MARDRHVALHPETQEVSPAAPALPLPSQAATPPQKAEALVSDLDLKNNLTLDALPLPTGPSASACAPLVAPPEDYATLGLVTAFAL